MKPRPIFRGATYLVSRRCTQREFLLTPTPRTTGIFGYCLAVAAKRFGILVHSVCVMSNHWHAVVTDPDARLPAFLAYLHQYVAKAINASLGRWENLWASEPPSQVRLLGPEDMLGETLYVATNPVAAGLVKRAERWPGLLCYLPRHSRSFERPTVFFRACGPMPPRAVLSLMAPPAWSGRGAAAFEQKLRQLVREEEGRVERELAANGRGFLGPKRVCAQQPTARPRTRETRRGLSPQVAGGGTGLRTAMLDRLKTFVAAYRQAWQCWRKGAHDVLFPAGTYALRVHAGVRCEPLLG
jgi:REP element-mobilizing transposase RayT